MRNKAKIFELTTQRSRNTLSCCGPVLTICPTRRRLCMRKHAVLVSSTCSPSCAMVMLIPNFGEKKKNCNQHPLSDIGLRLLTPKRF